MALTVPVKATVGWEWEFKGKCDGKMGFQEERRHL